MSEEAIGLILAFVFAIIVMAGVILINKADAKHRPYELLRRPGKGIMCATCWQMEADPKDAPCRDGLIYCKLCKQKGRCGC